MLTRYEDYGAELHQESNLGAMGAWQVERHTPRCACEGHEDPSFCARPTVVMMTVCMARKSNFCREHRIEMPRQTSTRTFSAQWPLLHFEATGYESKSGWFSSPPLGSFAKIHSLFLLSSPAESQVFRLHSLIMWGIWFEIDLSHPDFAAIQVCDE